jgi:putative ABC transport system substrate-binding protein
MRRREFITLIGGAAAVWPLAARPQQPAMPVVGFLSGSSADSFAPSLAAFGKGLQETGFDKGRNVTIEYRWAEGQYDRLPALAADLVRLQVAVIVASTSPAAVAAKAATATIPIVFASGEDPVKVGLVKSFNQPGGNATGVYSLVNGLEEKRLGLLRELVPQVNVFGAIVNPNRPDAEIQSRDLQAAARGLGLQIHIVNATSEREIDTAFSAISQLRAGALLVGADPSFIIWRNQFVALAARYAVPTMYFTHEFAVSGGLMSYGTNLPDGYRQVGIYTGQILKGEKPANLPVQQPTKFELIINLKTAKALGIEVPPGLLSIADEVIE